MQTLTAYKGSIYGIDFSFDSVAFTIPIGDGWNVYWYGICIAVGFMLAVVYCFLRAKKYGVDLDRLTDVVLFTVPLAIFCARLYYIIFDPSPTAKIESIGDFFGFSSASGVSGLAIYGGVIGAAVFGCLFCKLRKVNVLDALDLASSGFLIGQACGRWGNFFNQEAFGTLTSHGMMSNGVSSYIASNKSKFDLNAVGTSKINDYLETEGLFVHPTFLYESIWCILGFVLLHFVGKNRKFKGQLALIYGVWYGVGRAVIEGLRTDSLMLGPLKVSQWLSMALVLVCGIVLIYKLSLIRRKKTEETYVSLFDDIDASLLGEEEAEIDNEFTKIDDTQKADLIDETEPGEEE